MQDTFIPEVIPGGDEIVHGSEQEISESVSQQLAEPEEQVASSPQKPTPQQSWATLRQQKEQAESERDEAMRILRQLELQRQKQQAEPVQQEEDEEVYLGPDEIAEGKHLSQVEKKVRKLEEQLWQYQQKTTEMTAEAALKSKYPDFERVVSSENIKALKEEYPTVADSINSNQNIYSKAEAAYIMIKKLDIHKEDIFKEERMAVQKNISKPKPIASLSPQQGDSPMSKANAFANGLTPELQAQLRKEMDEARRNL